jgi:hypothetical protein
MGTTPPRMTGGSGWGKTGRVGHEGEMRLDGTDDYIDLGSPADLNLVGQMTFFCHAVASRSPSAVGEYIIAGGDATSVKPYGLTAWKDTTNQFKVVWGGATVAATGSIITAGASYYCGFVRSGGTGGWECTIYVNGVLYFTAAIATNPASFGAGKVTIGSAPLLASPGYFQGNVDDVMLWNRGLSSPDLLLLQRESRRGWPALLRRIPLTAVPGVVGMARSRSTIF